MNRLFDFLETTCMFACMFVAGIFLIVLIGVIIVPILIILVLFFSFVILIGIPIAALTGGKISIINFSNSKEEK